MNKDSLNNIDSRFHDAFDNWEAPHTDAEMQLDWNQVSAQISPAAPASPSAPGAVSGIGKLAIGLGSTAALITSAILIYNIYLSPQAENQQNVVTPNNHITEIITDYQDNIIAPDESHTDISSSKITTKSLESKNNSSSVKSKNQNLSQNSSTQMLGNPTQSKDIPQNSNVQQQSDNNNKDKNNNVAPMLMITASADVICPGKSVVVKSNTNTGLIQWGDGITQPLKEFNTHIYSKEGTYKVLISSGRQVSEKKIMVISLPDAHFNYFQYENNEVRFKDISDNAVSWHWNFGDGYTSSETNAMHIYKDTGLYKVSLAIQNSGGCADTGMQWIKVTPIVRPERQSVITPNGDHKNDELVIKLPPHTYFHLMIVDKAGRMVFESNDINFSWKGTLANGEPAPTGTYFYILQYRLNGVEKMQQEQSILDLRR